MCSLGSSSCHTRGRLEPCSPSDPNCAHDNSEGSQYPRFDPTLLSNDISHTLVMVHSSLETYISMFDCFCGKAVNSKKDVHSMQTACALRKPPWASMSLISFVYKTGAVTKDKPVSTWKVEARPLNLILFEAGISRSQEKPVGFVVVTSATGSGQAEYLRSRVHRNTNTPRYLMWGASWGTQQSPLSSLNLQ